MTLSDKEIDEVVNRTHFVILSGVTRNVVGCCDGANRKEIEAIHPGCRLMPVDRNACPNCRLMIRR